MPTSTKLVSDRMDESRAAAEVIDGTPAGGRRLDDRVLFLGSVDGELVNGRERAP